MAVDLAFSGAGNITDSWTVQQLVQQSSPAVNLGYDTKAPAEAEEELEEDEEDNG